MLYPLGPNIPLEHAAVIEPLAVVHHAVKESGIKDWEDKTVLVLGGGPVGFALLIDLRAHGATKIIVSEPASLRREQASEFAQTVIDPVKQNVADICQELTNGDGVDVVFDCAGVPVGLESAFAAIRTGGFYMMVAVWEVSYLASLLRSSALNSGPGLTYVTETCEHITLHMNFDSGTNGFDS